MTDLTRRRFLIGAPAVVAAVAVGVAVAPKAAHATDAERMYHYWRTASTETIALKPKAPYYVDSKDIAGVEPTLAINRIPRFIRSLIAD